MGEEIEQGVCLTDKIILIAEYDTLRCRRPEISIFPDLYNLDKSLMNSKVNLHYYEQKFPTYNNLLVRR